MSHCVVSRPARRSGGGPIGDDRRCAPAVDQLTGVPQGLDTRLGPTFGLRSGANSPLTLVSAIGCLVAMCPPMGYRVWAWPSSPLRGVCRCRVAPPRAVRMAVDVGRPLPLGMGGASCVSPEGESRSDRSRTRPGRSHVERCCASPFERSRRLPVAPPRSMVTHRPTR